MARAGRGFGAGGEERGGSGARGSGGGDRGGVGVHGETGATGEIGWHGGVNRGENQEPPAGTLVEVMAGGLLALAIAFVGDQDDPGIEPLGHISYLPLVAANERGYEHAAVGGRV